MPSASQVRVLGVKHTTATLLILILLGPLFGLLQGCDLTGVENPNVTNEKFLDSPQSAATWVNGARAQMASTLGVITELTEITSDNYFNNRTLSSKVFDLPQIVYTDLDVDRLQTAVQGLRRTAEFGLESVLTADRNSTGDQEAELYFYLGVAHLFAGEYFTGLPGEDLGPVLGPEEHFEEAQDAFDAVITLSEDTERIHAARLALARLAFHRGELSVLRSQAQAVIAATPALNYQVAFDGVNGPTNSLQFFLYDSSQDEFAPLPRLDFLDPKYFSEDGSGQDQKPISLFKVEEAYLMLAEADLVADDLPAARSRLIDLLQNVIADRPVWTIDDSRETRSGGNRDDYPLSSDFAVKASPDEPATGGLVLDRQNGPVSVPAVSGTSVTEAQINAASTVDELLEVVYLMRQEIFIGEGRRVVDLGIRYPVSENEVRANDMIDPDSPFTSARIPDFIPGNGTMDDFSTDAENKIVTLDVNMNSVLVERRSDDAVLPLW